MNDLKQQVHRLTAVQHNAPILSKKKTLGNEVYFQLLFARLGNFIQKQIKINRNTLLLSLRFYLYTLLASFFVI